MKPTPLCTTAPLLLLLGTAVVLGKPNGLYHQQYNYQTHSASYKNNELQHENEDKGFFSKQGDLEGRLKPKVDTHSEHSEYVNPKTRDDYQYASSFGQLNARNQLHGAGEAFFGQHQQNQADLLALQQQGDYGQGQANLRQMSLNLQNQIAGELQQAVFEQHRRSSAYTTGLTQSQIEADRRDLEEALRRNVTARLQEALQSQFGTQGIRGGYSYSMVGGRLQPVANYNDQELSELTRQLENNLVRQLNEQVQTRYHSSSSSSSSQSMSHQNYGNVAPYTQRPFTHQPFTIQPNVLPFKTHQPLNRPDEQYDIGYRNQFQQQQQLLQQQQPIYQQPHQHPPHLQQVETNVDSLTTIATRVQNDLNVHLNKILDDTRRRYFTVGAGASQYGASNFEAILAQLQNELRNNITMQFENEIRRSYGGYAPGQYNIEDLDNLKRQIESNLITKLNRDFNTQRERYFESSSQAQFYTQQQQHNNNNRVINYPVDNRYQQQDFSQLRRQLEENLSRQLQAAVQQQHRQQQLYRQQQQSYGGSNYYNPESNYQTTLDRLTDDLNRNLTRQWETSMSQYRLGQQSNYQSGAAGYDEGQFANMRSQLQNELQRQLQQGLQQSFSRYSSWSSSSSSSSSSAGAANGNYRPVRDSFGGSGLYQQNAEDCMMGDDPNAHLHRHVRSAVDDLSRHAEDLTQQSEDLSIYSRPAPIVPPSHYGRPSGSLVRQRVEQYEGYSNPGYRRTVVISPSRSYGGYQPTGPLGRVTVNDGYRSPLGGYGRHSSQPVTETHGYGGYGGPQVQFGQVEDDSDLTQQTEDIDFGGHGGSQIDQLGQQVEDDSDLTQQTEDFGFGGHGGGSRKPQNPKTGSSIDHVSDEHIEHNNKLVGLDGLTIQNESSTPQISDGGQQIDDSDLSQKTEDIDFGGYGQSQTNAQSQIDQIFNSNLNRRTDGSLGQNPESIALQTDHSNLPQKPGKIEFGGYSKPQTNAQSQIGQISQQKTEDIEFGGYGESQTNAQSQIDQIFNSNLNRRTDGSPRRNPASIDGQQVDDSDLSQNTEEFEFGGHSKPHPQGQAGQIGQISNSNLNRQPEGPIRQNPVLVGQQEDDSDLSQKAEDIDFGGFDAQSQISQIPNSNSNRQTGYIRRPVLNGQRDYDLSQKTDDIDISAYNTAQTSQISSSSTLNRRTEGNIRLNPLLVGQQVDDSDLSQKTEEIEFGGYSKPQTNGQTSYNLNRPTVGHIRQNSVLIGQQDSNLSQNTEDINFGGYSKPQSNPQSQISQISISNSNRPTGYRNPVLNGQVEDLDLSKKTEDIDISGYNKPQTAQRQTSQISSTTSNRRTEGNIGLNPLLVAQQVDDSDLSQKTEEIDFGGYSKPEHIAQSQIVQTYNPNLNRLPNSLLIGQQVDDSDLSQKTEDIGGPRSNRTTFDSDSPKTDVTPKPVSYNPVAFSQSQVDDSFLAFQQTEHTPTESAYHGQLTQQIQSNSSADLDLAQKVEDDHIRNLAQLSPSKPTRPSTNLDNQALAQNIEDQQIQNLAQLSGPNRNPITTPTLVTYHVQREPQVPDSVVRDVTTGQKQSLAEVEQQSQLMIQKLREQIQRRKQVGTSDQVDDVYSGTGGGYSEQYPPYQSQSSYGTSYNSRASQSSSANYNSRQSHSYTNQATGDQQQLESDTSYQYQPRPAYTGLSEGSSYGSHSSFSPSTYGGYSAPYSPKLHQASIQQLNEPTETAAEIESSGPPQSARAGVKTAKLNIDKPIEGDQEVKVSAADAEEVTTTAAPGFWSRLGKNVKTKAQKLKEQIG